MKRSVRAAARVASMGALMTSAACWFVDATPEDAALFCIADEDCPSALRCNTSSHLCTKPDLASDAEAPSLESATVEPAFAKDGDTVRVTVRASEVLTAASLVFGPDVPDPGFDVEVDGESATFALVVAAESPAGVIAIDGVRLRDEAGNERVSPVDALSFRIDRTPPAIVRATASGAGPGGVASDVAPQDAVSVVVEVDEPLSSLTAGFQALLDAPVACEPRTDASLAYNCALLAVPTLPNGINDIVVDAVDRAGNATSIEVSLFVDTAPPTVLPQTARALLLDGDGDLSPVLVPGGSLQVDFDLDEPPAGVPAVTLALGGESVPLVVTVDGLHVRAALASAAIDTTGDAIVKATLADAVGHTHTVTLALAPPLEAGIPVVATAPSSCENPAPGACPDADGDGALGLDDDCAPPLGADLDCDDDEPSSFPGAVDLPGDGLDNDCLGDGDAPIDESAWLFVHCPVHEDPQCSAADDEDDGRAGTRADPHKNLRLALKRARDSGRGVIADGRFFFPYATLLLVEAPLVGGVSASLGWERVPVVDGAPLTYVAELGGVEAATTAPIADWAGFDVVWSVAPGASLVRVAGGQARVDARVRVVNATMGGVSLRTGATDVQITGGVFGTVVAEDLSRMVITRARMTGGVESFEGADVAIVASEGSIRTVNGTVRVYGSRVSTDSVDRAIRLDSGEILIVNSVIAADTGGTLFDVCPEVECGTRSWTLVNTRIELAADATPLAEYGVPSAFTSADLLACTAPGCASVTNGEAVVPPQTGTLDGADLFGLGAPASAVADADGSCVPRLDGTFPVGPR